LHAICFTQNTTLFVLQDAAIFLRDHEDLFVAKLSSVIIVGGCKPIESRSRHGLKRSMREALSVSVSSDVFLGFEPDPTEGKIQSDIVAAKFFYERCQQLGVSLIIVPEQVRPGE